MNQFEYYANEIIMESFDDNFTTLKTFNIWFKKFRPKYQEICKKGKEYEETNDYKNALKYYKEALIEIKELRSKIASIPDRSIRKVIVIVIGTLISTITGVIKIRKILQEEAQAEEERTAKQKIEQEKIRQEFQEFEEKRQEFENIFKSSFDYTIPKGGIYGIGYNKGKSTESFVALEADKVDTKVKFIHETDSYVKKFFLRNIDKTINLLENKISLYEDILKNSK